MGEVEEEVAVELYDMGSKWNDQLQALTVWEQTYLKRWTRQ